MIHLEVYKKDIGEAARSITAAGNIKAKAIALYSRRRKCKSLLSLGL
jgi:hypothetical protein